MSALRNLAGKVRRLPGAVVELYRQFWARDRQTLLEDLRYEREQLRDVIARLQDRERGLSSEIRRNEALDILGIGS